MKADVTRIFEMTDTECISGYLRCVDMSTIHIAFRRMLVELSQNITEDELGAIKFMCADKVPKRCKEKLIRPFELWDALVERNAIAPGNTEFLKYILCHSVGGRTDLLEIVARYESDHTATDVTASQVVVGIHCQETLPGKQFSKNTIFFNEYTTLEGAIQGLR